MRGAMRVIFVSLAGAVLGGVLAVEVPAQEQSGMPVAPKSVAPRSAGTNRSGETYDALQAGQDAYRAAEVDRQAAVKRQLQVQDDIRRYNAWLSEQGDWPAPLEVYEYRPSRAFRRAYRYGFSPPPAPWLRAPGDVYGYPYDGGVQQPTGHEKLWTSPNGYIYRPRYNPPAVAEPRQAPRRPAPAEDRQVPSRVPPAPIPQPPSPPTPAPSPPSEPAGPQEL
jgi:hypothetical protein